jgi:exopolysaccharide biosynthesis polyprenyl glycosylphosphotransferase
MSDRALQQALTEASPALGTVGNLRRRAHRVALRPGMAWRVARLALDTAMLITACVAATMGSEAAGVSAPPGSWLVVFSCLVVGIFAARGMYGDRLHFEMLEDLRVVVSGTTLAAMGVLALREVFTDPSDVAAQTIRMWAFAAAYVAAGRVAVHWSRAQSHRHGESLRPTLIIGAGKVGQLTANRLLEHPEIGLRPIGFLDKDPMVDADDSLPIPVLGASWDLDRIAAQHDVEQVIITFSRAPHEVLLRLVRRCEELDLRVAFVPRLYEKVTSRLTVEHLGGIPFISARPANPKGIQFAIKYAADRVVAALFLLLTLPLILPAAAAILLTLGRPVFFRQVRVGRDGRTFEMLKFRTMRGTPVDCGEADADWAAEQLGGVFPAEAAGAGERVTRLGSLLRRSSIDEVPQLINVLKGDMSIVGPRPERVAYVQLFEPSIYRYSDRHRVKSGITGWAQVHGLRGKTSLSDRVEWDNYYIENWSLWLDVKVLLLTFLAIVRSPQHVE